MEIINPQQKVKQSHTLNIIENLLIGPEFIWNQDLKHNFYNDILNSDSY